MTLKEVLNRTTQFFREKNFETPRLEAEILLSRALKFSNRVDLYLKFDQPLKEHELQVCRDVVRRRSLGEPVAYIFNNKEFFGYDFKVNSDVLVPRPETEILIEQVLAWADPAKAYRILDLGAGSGCIGLTLAKKLPLSSVTLVDISAGAVKVIQENAKDLGFSGEEAGRISVLEADASTLEFQQGTFDIIVSNPPYIAMTDAEVQISVKKYEPHLALFAEEHGYQKLKLWSQKAAGWLRPQGFMGFEMGHTQGAEMKKHFDSLGVFSTVRIVKDLAGLDRHIIGER